MQLGRTARRARIRPSCPGARPTAPGPGSASGVRARQGVQASGSSGRCCVRSSGESPAAGGVASNPAPETARVWNRPGPGRILVRTLEGMIETNRNAEGYGASTSPPPPYPPPAPECVPGSRILSSVCFRKGRSMMSRRAWVRCGGLGLVLWAGSLACGSWAADPAQSPPAEQAAKRSPGPLGFAPASRARATRRGSRRGRRPDTGKRPQVAQDADRGAARRRHARRLQDGRLRPRPAAGMGLEGRSRPLRGPAQLSRGASRRSSSIAPRRRS